MSKAAIIKKMQSMAHRHDLWRVFSDFCEMAAVSISNAIDRFNPNAEAREKRYLEIAKLYTPEELTQFSAMLGMLANALEVSPGDVLGEVFMEMDLGSKWHGQFFTPYDLCRAMAKFIIGNPAETIEKHGFVTVNEPACGGGAMLIAFAEELRELKFNYQLNMHATAQDLDIKAVHMCYIQLSLLHIPAAIIHGNTLTNEQRSVWYTPAHVMGLWGSKLRRLRAMGQELASAEDQVVDSPPPEPEPAPVPVAAPVRTSKSAAAQIVQHSLF